MSGPPFPGSVSAVFSCLRGNNNRRERSNMPYVMISHKVANYAKWKSVVRSFAKMRKSSGEKCFYACRDVRHPNDVMVWCEWDTAARMNKFLKSADLRKGMKEAGVVGKPKISTFNKMDVLTVS